MEDTLRALTRLLRTTTKFVLILVLMEDTLRVIKTNRYYDKERVLILVLMEDTLRGMVNYLPLTQIVS